MNRPEFEQLVADALASIPRRFRRALSNIAIVVEDEPSAQLLHEMEIEPPDTLFGLYQGTPLTERHWGYGNTLPDRILLFQGPLERDSEDDDDLDRRHRGDADPRDRPLLRDERGTDRGYRGALLARFGRRGRSHALDGVLSTPKPTWTTESQRRERRRWSARPTDVDRRTRSSVDARSAERSLCRLDVSRALARTPICALVVIESFSL